MIEKEKSPVSVITKSKISELYLTGRNDEISLSTNFQEIFEDIYAKSSQNMDYINQLITQKKKRISKQISYERKKTFMIRKLKEKNRTLNCSRIKIIMNSNMKILPVAKKRIETMKTFQNQISENYLIEKEIMLITSQKQKINLQIQRKN
jgi:hypothetical protein